MLKLNQAVLAAIILHAFVNSESAFGHQPWEQVNRCSELVKAKVGQDLALFAPLQNHLAGVFFEIAVSEGFQPQTCMAFNRLVPGNIGLCTPTAFIYIVTAIRRFYSHSLSGYRSLADYQSYLMGLLAKRVDLRRGLSFERLPGLLDPILRELELKPWVTYRFAVGPQMRVVFESQFARKDKIWLAAVTGDNGTRHAIVILNLDIQRGSALVVDPNSPNVIWPRKIEMVRWNGFETIRFPQGLPNSGYQIAHLDSLISIYADPE